MTLPEMKTAADAERLLALQPELLAWMQERVTAPADAVVLLQCTLVAICRTHMRFKSDASYCVSARWKRVKNLHAGRLPALALLALACLLGGCGGPAFTAAEADSLSPAGAGGSPTMTQAGAGGQGASDHAGSAGTSSAGVGGVSGHGSESATAGALGEVAGAAGSAASAGRAGDVGAGGASSAASCLAGWRGSSCDTCSSRGAPVAGASCAEILECEAAPGCTAASCRACESPAGGVSDPELMAARAVVACRCGS